MRNKITKANEKMQIVLNHARASRSSGEIPIAAAIFRDDELISIANNNVQQSANATKHAEIIAIDKACSLLRKKYLDDCALFATLEPCMQCAGALSNAHIGAVIFGAYDPMFGCIVSGLSLNSSISEWRPKIVGGIYADECSELLSDFFKQVRNI